MTTAAMAEVANMRDVMPLPSANMPSEIYLGYPGLIVAEGQLRQMTWGFPLALTGKQGQKFKPNAVTSDHEDKQQMEFWKTVSPGGVAHPGNTVVF